MPREIRDQIFGYLLPPVVENSLVIRTILFPPGNRFLSRNQILDDESVQLLIKGMKFNAIESIKITVKEKVDKVTRSLKAGHSTDKLFGFAAPRTIGYESTKLAVDSIGGRTRTRVGPDKQFKLGSLLNVSHQIRDEVCDGLFKGRTASFQGNIAWVAQTFVPMPTWLLLLMEDVSLSEFSLETAAECSIMQNSQVLNA